MYKNFNLTESEKEQILKQHQSYGYKKSLNEQSEEDLSSDMGGEMDGPGEPRGSVNDVMDFVYEYISKKAPNGPGDRNAYVGAIHELERELHYVLRNVKQNVG